MRRGFEVLAAQWSGKALNPSLTSKMLYATLKGRTWHYPSIDAFLRDVDEASSYMCSQRYAVRPEGAVLSTYYALDVQFSGFTSVSVEAATVAEVDAVFEVFDANQLRYTLPSPLPAPKVKPKIFVGHGRSAQWRDLADHLRDEHGYQVQAFESGTRAGHTIRDVLETLLNSSSFAILVLTAEDEHADGGMHARENVIHEVGLFQGRLGFAKTLLLLEEGTAEFSNMHGIVYVPFAAGRIKETYGKVLATLRREFGEQ